MYMDKNQNVPVRENTYLALINECKMLVEDISSKIDVITSPSVPVQQQEISRSSEMEQRLRDLVEQLKELRDRIIS